ncbi:MAG: hypothetical protein E6G41_11160 [Actinobacteria bacterium]|nr:MAG: hypothetical protein E6G41_11160 [Actinomycetota bacterium]
MVRGPAAVLAVVAAAWVYFLIPKLLPAIHDEETSRIVASCVAAGLVVLVAAGVATLSDTPIIVPIMLLGAVLIAGVMNAAGVGAAASLPETVVYACIGVLLALWLDAPPLVLAIPVFVAGIEIIGTLGGTTHGPPYGDLRGGDVFTLGLPDWHNGLAAARIGLADVVFVGLYATYARRMGLRFLAGAIGMAIGLAAALALSIDANSALPELGFIGAGFLVPNIDRVLALFRPAAEG